jgi:hypothetical protein
MADRTAADDYAGHAEQRAFDPDVWGASPQGGPQVPRSVYDDGDLDPELVPQARSIMEDPVEG